MLVLDQVVTDDYALYNGDSVEVLQGIPDDSVDLSIYSPPFMSLYTYSPSDRDVGNSGSDEEFLAHYRFIITELLRTTKPGRNTCVHTADIPTMLGRDGVIGLKDFPGLAIQEYTKAGWIYHGRVTIDKNPQAQALRTHSKGLLFSQMEKDSSWSRPALGDYILVFRKPGENAVPIKPDVTRQEWILWARAVWYAADYTPGSWDGEGDQTRKSGEANLYGIRETDTLQYRSARDNDDERHICPLQLGTIERCVRLWSNKGETVLSPFAGIGSEGYQSLKLGRKFIGIELKESYFRVASKNLERALQRGDNQPTLFDLMETIEPAD